MALVVASSTASASWSGTGSWKPAASAIFFVISRTRARNVVWLGTVSTRAGFRARRRGAPGFVGVPERLRARRVLPEAAHGLAFGREDLVEVVEAQDLEDVADGLVEAGQPQVAAVAA